jgi:hypothetical protein
MMKHTLTTAVAGFSIAATMACGNGNTRNTSATREASPAQTAPAAADQKGEPVTLTGCLQEGNRRTYILTRLNEPSQRGVGTSGDGVAVEREQWREAANAYRIEAKNQVDMEEMLGKQVRVTGVISKAADLPSQPTDTNSTAGRDDKREEVLQGDLAKIEANSVTVVADNCGGRNDKSR